LETSVWEGSSGRLEGWGRNSDSPWNFLQIKDIKGNIQVISYFSSVHNEIKVENLQRKKVESGLVGLIQAKLNHPKHEWV
jgi:hypothetical protein